MSRQKMGERASPKPTSRRVQTLQILRRLNREHHSAKNAVLDSLALSDSDFTECMEALYQEAIDNDELVECGGCDHYHRPDFRGDCRNDDERFPDWA